MLYFVYKLNIIEKIIKYFAKYLAQTIYILDIDLVYILLKIVDFVI